MKTVFFIFLIFFTKICLAQISSITIYNGARIGSLLDKDTTHGPSKLGIGYESSLDIRFIISDKLSLTIAPKTLQHSTRLSTYYDLFDATNIGTGTVTLPNGFTYTPLGRESILGNLQLNYFGISTAINKSLFEKDKWNITANISYTYLRKISSYFKYDRPESSPELSRVWEPGAFGVHLFGIQANQHLIGIGLTLEKEIQKRVLISASLKSDIGSNYYTNDAWPKARLLGTTGSIGIGYKLKS